MTEKALSPESDFQVIAMETSATSPLPAGSGFFYNGQPVSARIALGQLSVAHDGARRIKLANAYTKFTDIVKVGYVPAPSFDDVSYPKHMRVCA